MRLYYIHSNVQFGASWADLGHSEHMQGTYQTLNHQTNKLVSLPLHWSQDGSQIITTVCLTIVPLGPVTEPRQQRTCDKYEHENIVRDYLKQDCAAYCVNAAVIRRKVVGKPSIHHLTED